MARKTNNTTGVNTGVTNNNKEEIVMNREPRIGDVNKEVMEGIRDELRAIENENSVEGAKKKKALKQKMKEVAKKMKEQKREKRRRARENKGGSKVDRNVFQDKIDKQMEEIVERRKNKMSLEELRDLEEARRTADKAQAIERALAEGGSVKFLLNGRPFEMELSIQEVKMGILNRNFTEVAGRLALIESILIKEGEEVGKDEVVIRLTNNLPKFSTKSQFDSAKKLFLTKNLKGKIRKIVVNNKEEDEEIIGIEAEQYIVGLDETRLLRSSVFDSYIDKAVKVGNSYKVVENFISEMITIEVNSEEALQSLKELFIREISSGDEQIFYRDKEGQMKILFGREDIAFDESECRRYTVVGYTASGLRQRQVALVDVTDGYELAEKVLDALTLDWYSIVKGKEGLAYADLVKEIGRVGQGLAPSSCVGVLKSFGYYNGKFSGNDNQDGMAFLEATAIKRMAKEKGLDVELEALFGLAQQCRPAQTKVLVETVAKKFMKLLVHKMDVVTFKFSDMTPELSRRIYKGDEFKGKLVVISEDGKVDVPEFLCDNNGLKSLYDFSIMPTLDVLAWAGNSMTNTSIQMLEKPMLLDSLATTSYAFYLFERHMRNEYETQVIDKQSKVASLKEFESDKIFASGIIKSIAAEYSTCNERGLLGGSIEDLARGMTRKITKMKFPIDGANLTLTSDVSQINEHIEGVEPILQFGELYAPDYNNSYKKNKGKKIKETIKEAESFIEEKKELLKDATGKKEIKRIEKEIYRMEKTVKLATETLEKHNSGKIADEIALFKYPTMGGKEYYVGKAISKQEILRRIDSISEKIKDSYERELWRESMIEYYSNIQNTTIVVPCKEELKGMLAGMDFDFDGAAAIYDPIMVGVLKELMVRHIVSIEAEKKEEEKKEKRGVRRSALKGVPQESVDVTEDFDGVLHVGNFHIAAAGMLKSAGLSVGEITNINTTIVGILGILKDSLKKNYSSEEIDLSHIGNTFARVFSLDKEATNKYKGLTKIPATIDGNEVELVRVTESMASSIIEEMRNCRPSVKNLISFLEDLNDVMRMYQEVTIDSVKTNVFITVVRAIVDIRYSLKDKILAPAVTFEAPNFKDQKFDFGFSDKKKVYFDSELSILREEMVECFKSYVHDLFARHEAVALTSEMVNQINFMRKDLLEVSDKFSLKKTVASIKQNYYTLNRAFGQALELCKGDEDLEKEIKDDRKRKAVYFSEQLRRLMKDLTPAERDMVVTSVSLFDETNEIKRKGSTGFVRYTLPEESILGLIDREWASVDVAGEVIVPAKGRKLIEGEEIFFTNGLSTAGTLLNSVYTGMLRVQKVGKKIYGVRAIKELVTIPTEIGNKATLRIVNFNNELMEAIANAEELTVKNKYQLHVDGEFLVNIKLDGQRFIDDINNKTVKVDYIDVREEERMDTAVLFVQLGEVKEMEESNNDSSFDFSEDELVFGDDSLFAEEELKTEKTEDRGSSKDDLLFDSEDDSLFNDSEEENYVDMMNEIYFREEEEIETEEEESIEVEEVVVEDLVQLALSLNSKTIKELKCTAKSKGIDVDGKKKKQEIITAIVAQIQL